MRLIGLENRVLLYEARGALVYLKSMTASMLSNNHVFFTDIWHRSDLEPNDREMHMRLFFFRFKAEQAILQTQ